MLDLASVLAGALGAGAVRWVAAAMLARLVSEPARLAAERAEKRALLREKQERTPYAM